MNYMSCATVVPMSSSPRMVDFFLGSLYKDKERCSAGTRWNENRWNDLFGCRKSQVEVLDIP